MTNADQSAAPEPNSVPSAAEPESSPPDLGFTLGERSEPGLGEPVPSATDVADDSDADPVDGPAANGAPVDIESAARELVKGIARELAVGLPAGWERLSAVFAMTVVGGVGRQLVVRGEEVLRLEPSGAVLETVRALRHLSADLGDGPWWRLLIDLDADGRLDVDYDYGDEPFPQDQLFAVEAYVADLREYPRTRLPMWLAAYLSHDDHQSRPPGLAARQARDEREAGITPRGSTSDFPDLPTLWARWAVMAAAFVAVDSQWGPRVLPSLGFFEGAKRSGSTLYLLPGDRAVFSGGVWNAPELDAAYAGVGPMPALYAGAPAWVADPVLNPRAASGMLSFCYWWERGRWYRGESVDAEELSEAVPGIWSGATVAQVIGVLLDGDLDERRSAAVDRLVAAAEAGAVNRHELVAVFGDGQIDAAMYQLTLAGIAGVDPEPITGAAAVELVRESLADTAEDLTGFPVDALRAERISGGWMVFVPVPEDEVAIGRALFYVADDGVVERSSSSVAPSRYLEGFLARARERFATAAG